MEPYYIIVWHNNAVEGTHQSVLLRAKTLGKILRDFAKLMALPASMHSFNKHNLIQLHGPNGMKFEITH